MGENDKSGRKYSTAVLDLDVGCGPVKRAELTVDLSREFRPTAVADARFLPFRDGAFERVYAFNVIEHIKDYPRALEELRRVCSGFVLIRFDKIYNLANWWTLEHEYIQHGRRLIPVPRLVKAIRLLLWFPFLRRGNAPSGRLATGFSSALIRLHLLDSWNYYRIRCGDSAKSRHEL